MWTNYGVSLLPCVHRTHTPRGSLVILWRNFFLLVGYGRRCLPKINVELFFVISAHPGFGIYDGSLASQVWSPCAVLGVATGPPPPPQAKVVHNIGSTATLASLRRCVSADRPIQKWMFSPRPFSFMYCTF